MGERVTGRFSKIWSTSSSSSIWRMSSCTGMEVNNTKTRKEVLILAQRSD